MKAMLAAFLALAAFGAVAHADELDNETVNSAQRALAANLPQTLVVRLDQASGSVAVLQSNATLDPTATPAPAGNYVAVQANQTLQGSELDQDSSTSGWYFYWYNYSYQAPTYYYYGYTYFYRPCFNYNYGNFAYHWYRWY